MSRPEKPYVDPPHRKHAETKAEQQMRRAGKVARDSKDQAEGREWPNHDKRGRGSR